MSPFGPGISVSSRWDTISRSWRALQQLYEGSCTQSVVDPLGLEKCLLLFTFPDGCLPRPAFLFARPQLQTLATSGLRHSRVSDWSEGWRFSWRKSRDTSPPVFLLAHPTLSHNPGTGLPLWPLFPRKLSSERENAATLWPLLVTTTWKSVSGHSVFIHQVPGCKWQKLSWNVLWQVIENEFTTGPTFQETFHE